MPILEKINQPLQSFYWLDPTAMAAAVSFRKEIYVNAEANVDEHLIALFYNLFEDVKEEIIVGPFGSWGDFCLETWNPTTNVYDYSIEGKSPETGSYLQLLSDEGIEPGYQGFCRCEDWRKFLSIVLPCIVQHKAMYSMRFYHLKEGLVFYFHHTGSIGILYKTETETIAQMLETARLNNYYIDNRDTNNK